MPLDRLPRKIFRALTAALLVVSLPPLAATAEQNEAQLQPHRAVYDLTLEQAEDRSGISDVDGRMVIELTGSRCEGWTANFRMVNEYLLRGGQSRVIDSRSSTWESADGTKLRFSQRQIVDQRKEEEALVRVDRDAQDEPGEAELVKPAQEKFELKAGTLFPIAHQLRLVERAHAGARHDRSVVYDGSEGSKSYIASSFIGEAETKTAESVPQPLQGMRVWPMTISYFTTDEAGSQTPEYMVSFQMYENGVAGSMTLDYGNYGLAGELLQVELLEPAPCD